MKPNLFFLSIFFFAQLILTAQGVWKSPGFSIDWNTRCMYNDTLTNTFYIGGNFSNLNGRRCDGAVKIDSLGVHNIDSTTYKGWQFLPLSLTRYGSDILMGEWSGLYKEGPNGWDTVQVASGGFAPIANFYHYQNQLLMVGSVEDLLPVSNHGILVYDGTAFQDFKSYSHASLPFSHIFCVEEYQGKVVFGGSGYDSPFHNIVAWDSLNGWHSLSTGVGDDRTASVNDMVVYKGELYAGGSFADPLNRNNHISGIARWNGTEWKSLGKGIGQWGEVLSMTVYEDQLWVAGIFDSAGSLTAQNIAVWDGVSWAVPGQGLNGIVYNLDVYNDQLWAGGGFENIGGDSTLSYLVIFDTTSTLQYDSLGIYYGMESIVQESATLQIFPNPSNGTFNIQCLIPGILKIHDMNGKLIVSSTVSDPGRVEISLDRGLPDGVYFITLQSESTLFSQKLLLNRDY